MKVLEEFVKRKHEIGLRNRSVAIDSSFMIHPRGRDPFALHKVAQDFAKIIGRREVYRQLFARSAV